MSITTHDSSLEYSSPVIVLRKGKVELQIKNAAAIIKKIDALHPNTDSYSWNRNWNKINRELSDAEKTKQRKWMDAAQEWFREEFFGGENNGFEVLVKEKEEPAVSYNEEKHTVNTPMGEFTPECIEDLSTAVRRVTPQPETVRSVNKNAYELRHLILENSIGVVDTYGVKKSLDEITDDIIKVCKKFYSFVENKR